MTSARHQSGSVLFVCLMLLAVLASLLYSATSMTSLHARLIGNYQHYFDLVAASDTCLQTLYKNLAQIPDARLWRTLRISGLYYRVNKKPINLGTFDWQSAPVRQVSPQCWHIAEYLGTVASRPTSQITRHIVRISLRVQTKTNSKMTVQTILAVETNKTRKQSMFTQSSLKQLQWTQLD